VSHAIPHDRPRSGCWLSRRRIVAISGTLIVLQLLVLGFLVAGSYGLVTRYGPNTVSFVSFYAAGELALRGYAPLAYDEPILGETEEDLTHPGTHFIPFLYPPVYLLVCAPLAFLPALAAFAVFEATTLALYLLVVRRILGASGWQFLLPALAFPATFWTIGYGQNAFLSAALLGAATLLIDRRPAIAGSLLGMLCYKPHFLMLLPIALLAGRRWTTIASATVTVAILVGLSVILFGPETWQSYLHSVVASAGMSDFAIDRINIFASISPFAAARLLGLSSGQARLVQLVATACCVLLVAWVWGTRASLPVRAAMLAAGTVVAVPYALLYDLMLAAIGGAWLIRAASAGGFSTWEVPALAAIFILPLFAFQAGLVLHLPLAPLTGAGLLLVTAIRAWQERGRLPLSA
jgi:alpha-1,2-mannosyltransferase